MTPPDASKVLPVPQPDRAVTAATAMATKRWRVSPRGDFTSTPATVHVTLANPAVGVQCFDTPSERTSVRRCYRSR